MKPNTEISFSFRLTLFYSIPLLALTDRLTDGLTEERMYQVDLKRKLIQKSLSLSDYHSFTLSTLLALTDSQRNNITRFAWAGGTCPRFAWARGTFFPVVLLFQFFVLAGNRFLVLRTTYVLRVPYSCGVMLVFLVLAGNGFWCYVRTQCTIQLCGCVLKK